MGAVIPFDFETVAVRVVMVDGEPVFVAADVCRVVEISKYRDAVAQLDEDERVSVLVDTLGGRQTMAGVTESGLYALIMMSRKPAAKRFRKWVTAEVLPAIRRDGHYALPVPEADPFATNAARVSYVSEHLSAVTGIAEFVMQVTHLPIWSNGRRPAWWHDIEVRSYLTAAHRQMSIVLAERRGQLQFGARCPKKSAIHSYWQRLDRAFGPLPPSLPRDIPRPPHPSRKPSKKEAA